MLFNSIEYIVFLPIVFFLYWIFPQKYRWILLLVSSYYFYMSWNVKYVVLILLTTVVSYSTALILEKVKTKTLRKLILAGALVICLGVLFVFKYFNFFFEALSDICRVISIPLHSVTLKLVLPVGISFYTFQTLSYIIDVYQGKVKVEHHFGIYATFIAFFPQLVAGPIERTENLLPQIKSVHKFDYEKAMYGLKLMLWGYFKKLVIADQVGIYVDKVYNNLAVCYGMDYIIAILFFTVQIYCDFSGYSDIAIGTAKLLDIELMTNFKSPYFSTSMKEFWSRWHISLSTWFRDYVYIPLGGNRCSKVKRAWNLMITFLVSGLWHGANWTFVIWGGIHGTAQVLENMFSKHVNKLKEKRTGRIIMTLLVFAFCNLAWVFFRAESFTDACFVIYHAFESLAIPSGLLNNSVGLNKGTIAVILVTFLILGIYDFLDLKDDVIVRISRQNIIVQWAFYIFLGLAIVFLSQKGVAAEFVYFQF